VSLASLEGAEGYGEIADGALGWRDGVFTFVGPRASLPGPPATLANQVIEGHGWVTPALVDCHTHLVFAGDRAREFELRLQGATYEEIARAGGGIVSSVRATRAASEDALFEASLPRARALLADGVATIEIKSGYGLDLDSERRMLRVARRIGEALGVTVRTTYLAAHALPPEFAAMRRATSTRCATGCPACMPKGWWMRSMRSARASAFRLRRRGACSKPRARSSCR
jgi:imidazolonepropionase